ncbi:hypothetical protein SNEBB_009325 [Seison nebaliae]|nr:hypothetical protein SNEBB_009325 [Seison nebaliae]
MTRKRGALIVFEGVDGCGKSTQIKMVQKRLGEMNIGTRLFTFPDRSTLIGKLCNDYLKGQLEEKMSDEFVHMIFSLNRREKKEEMMRLLENGETILCDRYVYSGLVYSAAKSSDLSVDWLSACDGTLPEPDLIVYLKISVDDLKENNRFKQEEIVETEQFQRKVYLNYEKLFQKNNSSKLLTIDGRDSPSKITDLIVKDVYSRFPVIEESSISLLTLNWHQLTSSRTK